jgi:hypothetical protein
MIASGQRVSAGDTGGWETAPAELPRVEGNHPTRVGSTGIGRSSSSSIRPRALYLASRRHDSAHLRRLAGGPRPVVDISRPATCQKQIPQAWNLLSYHPKSMYTSRRDDIRFARLSCLDRPGDESSRGLFLEEPGQPWWCRSRRCPLSDWPTAMRTPKTASCQNRGCSESGWHGCAG